MLLEPEELGVPRLEDDIHLIWELPNVENVSDIPGAWEKNESVKLTNEEETVGSAPVHSKITELEISSLLSLIHI